MPDFYGPDGRKLSTAFIIPAPDKSFWCIRRTQGNFNNSGMISFPGSDGHDIRAVVEQAQIRLGFITSPQDWKDLGIADNAANNEWKKAYGYQKGIVIPSRIPGGHHEKDKYANLMPLSANKLWELNQTGELSPAAKSVMLMLPMIFGCP